MIEGPLEGLRVVVCRPRDQAAPLARRLEAEGAEVVFAPVIAIAEPEDGGTELGRVLAGLTSGDWLIVTSPNGAVRAAASLDGRLAAGVKVAAIGPGTADRLREHGLPVDLVPRRSVAEGLLEVFPRPGRGTPTAALARADIGRQVLPVGLRAMGWQVLDVVAYRTVTAPLDDAERRAAAAAEVVTFTSSSTVDALVAALGVELIPPVVASIGPATSATIRDRGLEVTVEAEPHTVPGLVDALVEHARTWGRDQQ